METREAEIQKMIAAETRMATARAIVIVFGLVAFFMLDEAQVNERLSWWLIPVIWIYGGFVLFYKPYRKYPIFLASWFTYTSDCLFITAWIFVTGGYYSPFHIIYYASMIAVAFRFGLRTTLFSAGLYVVIYSALIVVMGQFEGHEAEMLVRCGFIFIVGYMATLVTRETLSQTQQKLRLKVLMEEAQQSEEKLKKVNLELRIRNDQFEHAEENAGLGSYYWNLDTMKIQYSDNLYRLLGHEPGDFEPSLEKYADFVHPDDREQYVRGVREMVHSRKVMGNTVTRIINKNGSIRYVRSNAKIMFDSGKTVLIGTLQDISNDVAMNDALREKNAKLEQINNELSSFNYVASHDLQEPVRKILTFVQLVRDKEKTKLDDATQNYLDRVVAAARRMQNLIEAFLHYSRIDASKHEYERVDLNEVMTEVKKILADQLDEKKAVLQWSELPAVNGVRFQLQQLFVNLVGNALKYASPERNARISMTCSKVEGVELETSTARNKTSYWKISIKDNGIGFDPLYKEKIFEVFQRLHSKDSYEGTGIGLAIVRKIVTNHGGFVRAEAEEGQGATFHVYFPQK